MQTRYEHPGIDHGTSAVVLAELRDGNSPGVRVVWYKGHKTPVCGVRGFGHVYREAELGIVGAKGYRERSVFKAGRLSRKRIMEHAAHIDDLLGEGAAELIDPARTLIIVRD